MIADETINEQVVVLTLVTNPHILPLASLAKLRVSTLATPLKLHMPSTISQGVEEVLLEDIDIDEVIELLKYDLSTITLDQMWFLQEVLKRKTRQEKLWKEHK